MASFLPHIVMTATPGRSGTKFLQQLLLPCPESFVGHESAPGFQLVLKDLLLHPEYAKRFCADQKIPFIRGQPCRHYIETGHLFCKGFLESFVDLGIKFDLIVLRRDPRSVAKSLERLRCVPGKTTAGLNYLLHPDRPDVLPMANWQNLTDYQLCYWYAIEIERRQTVYTGLVRQRGDIAFETSLDQLKTYSHFQNLCDTLGLSLAKNHRLVHARLANRRVNKKWRFLRLLGTIASTSYDAQEQQVHDLIGQPNMITEILNRYSPRESRRS